MSSTLSTELRRPARHAATSGLLVEQAPWTGGVGRVTRINLVEAVAAVFYGSEENEIDCGVDGDAFESGLFVYPFDLALNFTPGLTHGTLGPRLYEEVEVRERLSFSLETEARVKYPIRSIKSCDWLADTWDAQGAVGKNPALSFDGPLLKTSAPVYGTAEVVYMTSRFGYQMTIEAREDSVENVYQSVAWVRYAGGVEMLEIEPPPGAEADYLNDTDCRFGTGGIKVPPRPFVPPDGFPVYDSVKIDYCTQCMYLDGDDNNAEGCPK